MLYLRHLTLAAALAAATPAAFAQDATTPDTASGKRISIVGGYALAEPTRNPVVGGTRARLDGDGAATLGVTYHVNDNIGIEAWGAADKFGHRVRTADGKAASVNAQPYALSGQYRFGGADRSVRPFVGLGYYESNYDGEKAEPTGAYAGQRIGIETAKGAMATAGVDLNFGPTWFARADARYLQGDSDVRLDGVKAGKAAIEPVIVGVGVGARF